MIRSVPSGKTYKRKKEKQRIGKEFRNGFEADLFLTSVSFLTHWEIKNSMFAESKRHILYNVDTYTEKIAMRTIHVEFSDERLITPSGLVFVGQILGKSDFVNGSI